MQSLLPKDTFLRTYLYKNQCKADRPLKAAPFGLSHTYLAGPRSVVGNVSGYRCVSDCRSRGRKSIPVRSHTFVEIDLEMISTVMLLPSADSFKKGCCQLQAKVCARITG